MQYTAKRGHRYRARVQVGIFKRSFASEGVVADQFKGAGFVDVVVQKAASAGLYWAWGRWPNADCTSELPSEVEEVVDLGPA